MNKFCALAVATAAAVMMTESGCINLNNKNTVVRYEDFGAKGDGKTCDLAAISAAHAYANEHDLPVRAKDDATYYMSGADKTVIVQTDTDWGTAKFMIDDRNLVNHEAALFQITSRMKSYPLKELTTIKRDQKKIDIRFPVSCVIRVINKNKKQYIRKGNNRNNGADQQDTFCVDKNGNVDMNAPILWDFEQITSAEAYPIDEKKLTVRGGTFTTIANVTPGISRYIKRNILVMRSNTDVKNVIHRTTGAGNAGFAYSGFFYAQNCAYVRFENCVLTGQRFYYHAKNGARVPLGTYDFGARNAQNVSLINCTQTNDHTDRKFWGVMGTNYCKNLTYDNCKLSRFDAHCGVANATIRNSDLGHMGINAIGRGTFLIENTICRGPSFVWLRDDYGSTWEGKFVIRNCEFVPRDGSCAIFNGYNDGSHDFGYTCYMPEEIVIENLLIRDGKLPKNYKGPVIFANFNRNFKTSSYKEKYPYIKSKRIYLKNVRTESGKPLRLSDNMEMFKDMEVIQL